MAFLSAEHCQQLYKMKVYRIVTDINPQYAHIHAQMGQDLSKGIKVIWDDGLARGNIIPDFVYSTYIICRHNIASDLQERFNGLIQVELCFEKNPKELIAKNLYRLKWLPKENVKLTGIYTDIEVPALSQSTLRYGISGLTGKECIKEIIGGETLKGNHIVSREKDKGIFFRSEDIGDYGFFKPVNAFFLLCTEKVKSYMQEQRYSNLIFLEVGDIFAKKETNG